MVTSGPTTPCISVLIRKVNMFTSLLVNMFTSLLVNMFLQKARQKNSQCIYFRKYFDIKSG